MEATMNDEVRLEGTRIENLEAQPTVAVRIQQPMAELDLGAAFDRYMPLIGEQLGELGATAVGAPFGRYHRFGPDVVDVEIGFPVDRAPASLPALASCAAGEIGASELPAGLVARTTHLGPYDNLSKAYDALHDWIHAQPGVDDGDGPWESYVDNPMEVSDPGALRTEIVWPLRQEARHKRT
jgi:effector-binding domain-containing protein